MLYIIAFLLLWKSEERGRGRIYALGIMTSMLVVATAVSMFSRAVYLSLLHNSLLLRQHLIVDFIRALHAFLPGYTSGGAVQYYENLTEPLFLVKTVFYWLQTLIGDSVAVGPYLYPYLALPDDGS